MNVVWPAPTRGGPGLARVGSDPDRTGKPQLAQVCWLELAMDWAIDGPPMILFFTVT